MKRQRKDYYTGKNYVHARDEAFKRSDGMCQLCGCRKATVAHHYTPSGRFACQRSSRHFDYDQLVIIVIS